MGTNKEGVLLAQGSIPQVGRDAGYRAEHESHKRSTVRPIGSMLVLVVGALAGIAIVVGASSLFGGASGDRQVVDAPIWGTASIREVRQEYPVALTLSWSEPLQVFAPSWSGLVTRTPAIDSPIKTGDVVVEIDGVDRLASVGLPPFYRSLGTGSSGEDVEHLHAFLNQMGIAAPSGARWTWGTTVAIRKLNDAIGQSSRDSFDPSVIVWVPDQEFELTRSFLTVGTLAPAAGELVFEQESRVLAATFNPPLPIGAMVNPTTPTPLTGWELQIDEFVKTVELIDDNSLVSADAIGEDVIEGRPGSVTGVLRTPQLTSVLVVPPAAILVDSSGNNCVIVRLGSSISTHPVSIVGGAPGATYLSQDGLSGANEVLLNAALIESDRTCSL